MSLTTNEQGSQQTSDQGSLLSSNSSEAIQKLTKQQKALFEVISQIRASLDLDTIFQVTTTEVRRLLNADRVGVFRFYPDAGFDNGEFVSEAVLPEYPSALAAKIYDHCFGDRYAIHYANGHIQAIHDIYNSGLSDCHIEVLAQFQIKANLIVPLLQNNRLWGLLCIHQCSAPRYWQPDEIEFVAHIAEHLGVALQQAELLSQTQQQTTILQQATEQQRALFEVVAKIRESLNVETIFRNTCLEVCQVLKADRISVYRFNPDWSGEFVSDYEAVLSTWESTLKLGVKTVWDDTYLRETKGGRYRHNETLAVDDIEKAGHSDCHVEILRQYGIRAYAIAPIFVGQTLWGLLAGYHNLTPRHWTASEVEFLAQVATQLGVALNQADLLTQTKQQTNELAQTLHELQQAQTHLIQTEKMSSLGQLVAGVAHEINNPVNFIYGNLNHATGYIQDLLDMLELYQRHYPDPVTEIRERAKAVDIDFLTDDLPKIITSMKTGADRIRQIVLSLRSFSRFDQADMKAVDIHEGIDSTLLILQHRLKAKSEQSAIQVVKNYGSIPPVECFAGQLNQVFMNLISNAIDALQEGGTENNVPQVITISTCLLEDTKPAPTVRVKIADNGMGVPAHIRDRIFDPFFTTKPVGKGTGLGLSISYQIVTERHSGNLRCFSQPGEGTEFQIEIPLKQVETD